MKFLGRAKKFLQDLGPEAPSRTQTFNLACPSGHRVRGERTEGYQALRCPACGEGVFVLPQSPLPEPEPPAGVSARPGRARARSPWADEGPIELTDPGEGALAPDDGDGAEVIWDDEPAAARAAAASRVAPEDLAAAEIEEARRARPEPERPRREPAAAQPAAPKRRPAVDPDLGPIVVEERPRRRRGPRLGLIFAGLALLVVATVAWRVRIARRAEYPKHIEQGVQEGIPALESGEFDRAFQILARARSAVDALGGAVEDAETIRTAADEAAVFNDLCSESLEDLLAEAGRLSPDEWESKFSTLYKGHYYIFDTVIESIPGARSGSYGVSYAVFPPGEVSRFGDGGLARPDRFARIDLSGFELFEVARPSKDHRVIFGARLRGIVYDGERQQWMIQLEPKSGVFITHTRALLAIGWPEVEGFDLPKEDEP